MISISEFSFDNPRFQSILNRASGVSDEIAETVERIISDVHSRGDEALFEYMARFDDIELAPETVRVSEEEFEQARDGIDQEFAEALKEACDNLFRFHQYQLPKSYTVDYADGVKLQRTYRPLQRVGVCVPGGAAPLSSTLYMSLIPALVAGVPEISVITAPRDGRAADHILFVAEYLDVRTVYKISGAQGIAALAYGTGSIGQVDKIVGPGNIYTQTAKRLLFGTVGIDSLAGPSEIAIIADETAPARYVAADLLSQAEHGSGLEASVAFCTTYEKAEEISGEVVSLIGDYELDQAVAQSLLAYGNLFVVEDLDTAVSAVNTMAPEHLEIICEQAELIVADIVNAGAIFVGPYSSEPVGDYYCGTNHVLPTGGTARFSSGLSVHDFMRSYSVVRYTRQALLSHGKAIQRLAQAEGLSAHALAVQVRQSDN
jgi:histidinol dehydrogenase